MICRYTGFLKIPVKHININVHLYTYKLSGSLITFPTLSLPGWGNIARNLHTNCQSQKRGKFASAMDKRNFYLLANTQTIPAI